MLYTHAHEILLRSNLDISVICKDFDKTKFYNVTQFEIKFFIKSGQIYELIKKVRKLD